MINGMIGLTFHWQCWNCVTSTWATFRNRNPTDIKMIHDAVVDFVRQVRRWANHPPGVILLLGHFQHQNYINEKEKDGILFLKTVHIRM